MRIQYHGNRRKLSWCVYVQERAKCCTKHSPDQDVNRLTEDLFSVQNAGVHWYSTWCALIDLVFSSYFLLINYACLHSFCTKPLTSPHMYFIIPIQWTCTEWWATDNELSTSCTTHCIRRCRPVKAHWYHRRNGWGCNRAYWQCYCKRSVTSPTWAVKRHEGRKQQSIRITCQHIFAGRMKLQGAEKELDKTRKQPRHPPKWLTG